MIEEKTTQVRNLTGYPVIFVDEDSRRRIHFRAYEEKTLPIEYLYRLNYSRGGQVLLNNYLCVEDADLAEDLGIEIAVNPEYNWTRKDIVTVLTKSSLDRLLDALDFAPEGIVESLVDMAIELEINDMSKREALFKATGKDITQAIENKRKAEAPTDGAKATKKGTNHRRVQTESEQPERRTTPEVE